MGRRYVSGRIGRRKYFIYKRGNQRACNRKKINAKEKKVKQRK